MKRESNNDVGTHDHEYRNGNLTKRKVRVETCLDGGHQDYYIDDIPKGGYFDGKCRGMTKSDPWHNGQCSYKGRLEYRGFMFCKMHHPPTSFARQQENDRKMWAKINARTASYQRQDDLRAFRNKALEALREIAKGELNDPAGYAAMILEEEPK